MKSLKDNTTSIDNNDLILRGRVFSAGDIEIIKRCVEQHYDEGRTAISRVICEQLDWRQPNGWLKDRACRDVLLSLEKEGIISLPPPLTKRRGKKNKRPVQEQQLLGHLNRRPVSEFPKSITLEFAKSNGAEKLWNELVRQYHYLGHKVIVGRNIKYLIWAEDQILGAIAYSSATWHVAARDGLLTKIGILESEIRDVVINNSRFLILPYVNVRNLASFVLSQSTKQIVIDWQDYYALRPLVAETFVQPSRFHGTCYRAANWLEAGLTKGYSKSGNSFSEGKEPKLVFLYGLNRSIRRKLHKALIQY